MSAEKAPRQISPADLARSVAGTPSKLAATAAVCMLLCLLLPAIYVSASVLGISSSLSFSGSQMGGWTAWVAFVAFAAAAATRFVPSILQYRQLVDLIAFGMLAAVLLYVVLASPIAAAVQQVHQVQNQFGSLLGGDLGRGMGAGFGNGFGHNVAPVPPPGSFSVLPHIGTLFFVLAPMFLFAARRRERVMLPSVLSGSVL